MTCNPSADELAEVQAVLSARVPMRYTPHTPGARFHAECYDYGPESEQLGRAPPKPRLIERLMPRLEAARTEQRNARFVIANAGRRSGKTQCGGAEVGRRIVRDYRRKLRRLGRWVPTRGKSAQPFLRYGIVAPTYALLDEPKIALQKYLGAVEEGGLIVDQTDQEWWLKGGIRLDMLSADIPKRLVSHMYDGLWLEEAARMKADVWVDNLQPTITDSQGWALFTTTPLGKNWVWEEIWAKSNPDAAAELARLRGVDPRDILDSQYRGLSWTTADNDALPHLMAEMLRAEKVLPRAMFLRNYFASFEAFAGQMLDIHKSRHFAFDEPPSPYSLRQYAVGGDLGQKHRSAFCLIGEDKGGVWQEYDTISGPMILFHSDRDWLARDTAADVRRMCWTVQVYRMLRKYFGDMWHRVPVYLPMDRDDVRRQFEGCGFKVEMAYQQHEPAVAYIQGLLYVDRLRVRSAALWRCLQNLRVPDVGRHSTKVWIDEDDDEWDALRYALSSVIQSGESPMLTQSFSAMGWYSRG